MRVRHRVTAYKLIGYSDIKAKFFERPKSTDKIKFFDNQ